MPCFSAAAIPSGARIQEKALYSLTTLGGVQCSHTKLFVPVARRLGAGVIARRKRADRARPGMAVRGQNLGEKKAGVFW